MLQLGASFCILQIQTEKQVEHHAETESKTPCEIEYEECLNGKSFYLFDHDVVGCNCSCWYGGQHCEKQTWLDWVRI